MLRHPTFSAPPDLLPTLAVPRLPHQHRGLNTWERLLIAGDVVFSKHGYSQATVDAITAEAKVSTGTFYRYLRDKRQLLLVLLGEALDLLSHELAAVDLSRDPLSSIERLVQWLVDPETAYHGLWRAWQEATIQDAELLACDQKISAWIRGILLETMQREGEKGHLRPELDQATTAHVVTTLLRQLSREPAVDPETLSQSASRMIYHALFTDHW